MSKAPTTSAGTAEELQPQSLIEALNPLVTEQQVSCTLGVTVHTLRCWRSLGRGPAYVKIGRNVKYRPSSVICWIENQEHQPGDQYGREELPSRAADQKRELALPGTASRPRVE